jgi:hypothetical protein
VMDKRNEVTMSMLYRERLAATQYQLNVRGDGQALACPWPARMTLLTQTSCLVCVVRSAKAQTLNITVCGQA